MKIFFIPASYVIINST